MSSKLCPKCGRRYPSSYRSCPYCSEEGRGRRARPETLPERIVDFLHQYGERIFLVSSVVFIMIAILGMLLTRCSSPDEKKPDDSKAPDQQQTDQNPEDPVVEPLAISQTTMDLLVGDTASLTVSGGNGTPVWTSSEPSVATVEGGAVTTNAAGTTVITVTVGMESRTCTIHVTAPEPQVEIYLNRTDFTLRAADPPFQMKAKVVGTKLDYEGTVVWASNDVNVVKVSETGLVERVGRGTTTITATVGSQVVECIVRAK